MTRERQGIVLVVLSGLGFGAMGVLAKLAYDAGVGVTTLLALRFTIAAIVFWVAIGVRRRRGGRGTRRAAIAWPRRRVLAIALVLGGGAYTLESGAFFAALTRIDVSLASLLLYAYPALVTVAAIALGRERPDRRRLAALAAATAGVALVLAGAGTGRLDLLGAGLALGAAVGYSAYILGVDRLAREVDPVMLTTLVCSGAALAFSAVAVGSARLDLGFGATGWLMIGSIAMFSTVMAITCFLAGIARVGPARASIASTIEPPFTIGLATLVFGETLGPLQLLGGALVLAAVIALALPRRRRVQASPAAAVDPALAPARS